MKPDVESTNEERDQLAAMDKVACGVQTLQFTQVDEYTTFRAEYAWDGENLVFHFFRTELNEKDSNYWLVIFPKVLDVVARDFFQADSPRLRAAYTEELESWWLRANGYGNVIDRKQFAEKFLEKMDQALDTQSSK